MPACPLMHGTGMAALAPTLGGGGKLVLLAGRGLDVDELWSTVEREGVNSLVIVGDAFARPMLRGLQRGPRAGDLGCVRFVFSAGAMFSAEVREGLLEHLPTADDHRQHRGERGRHGRGHVDQGQRRPDRQLPARTPA